MEIYHVPLAPCGGDNGYRTTHEYYEADADTLKGYMANLLTELNDGSGAWRPVKAEEIKVYGHIPAPYYVLCGEYPDEPPIMVAFMSKEKVRS